MKTLKTKLLDTFHFDNTVSSDGFVHLDGTDKADIMNLTGSTSKFFIHGNDGNDVITGGDHKDIIYGDNGNDTINGGKGADEIHGGLGNDSIDGGGGNDLIFATTDDVEYNQFSGEFDFIHGGNGDDTIYGLGSGSSSTYSKLYGDNGNDTIIGHEHQTLDGGNGNDYLEVVGDFAHHPTFTGSSLLGGAGDDTLVTNVAQESKFDTALTGGAGNDTFIFKNVDYHDVDYDYSQYNHYNTATIWDFNTSADKIIIDTLGYAPNTQYNFSTDADNTLHLHFAYDDPFKYPVGYDIKLLGLHESDVPHINVELV